MPEADRHLFDRRPYNIDDIAFLAAALDSSRYALQHMIKARRFDQPYHLLQYAASLMPSDGLILEFGVASGRTINLIAAQTARNVYGFDSFQGLPEDWRPGVSKGFFKREDLPEVVANVELVVGWFDATLPAFLTEHEGPVAFLHVDCDLYSSTRTVLAQLASRIVPGTIIVFDEYFNYPGWQLHEYRALQEFAAAHRLHYDYIAIAPGHEQVTIKVLGIDS